MQTFRLKVVNNEVVNSIQQVQEKPQTLKLKVNPYSNQEKFETLKVDLSLQTPEVALNPIESKSKNIKLKIGNPIIPVSNMSTPSPKSQSDEYRITADEYSSYDQQRDHIYDIPGMYIGSPLLMEREERLLDLETMLFKTSKITLSQGAEKIFIEVFSNAGDNAIRSIKKSVDPGEITVTMTETIIKVRNGGIPIPVEIHPTKKIYAPELIFGTLMSGSNYGKDKVRTASGAHGVGSKMTNIFSKLFRVTVADPFNEKLYVQVWTENMKIRNDPVISPYPKTEKGFVEVEYVMDFLRFGHTEMKYPKEAFELFARHVLDMAFTLKIPVSFNGKKFHIKNAKDYAKLYLGKEAVKNSILHISWPEGTEVVNKKGVDYTVDKTVLPVIELCVVDTPDTDTKISFVNGLWTRNNGVHYETAFKAIATGVLDTVNGNNKGKKNKVNDKEKKAKSQKLTLSDVKRHVSIFVNCWIENPQWDSNLKTELKGPSMKVSIDEKVLRPIMRWDLVNRLYAELDAKMFRNSIKTDGKKKRRLSGMNKLQDANKAATSESYNCTLYITEGDSAQTFASQLISYVPNGRGRDYIGTFPLRGKPLNVMNAPFTQINENKEINELKRALGLREGVNYLEDENYMTLRYGHLVCICDSDVDGKHILGLVLNLFHCKYPTLLARGYLKYLRTKIVEVSRGGEKIKFYTLHDYETWQHSTPDYDKWKHKYFKGLASSTDSDILEESQDLNLVFSVYDENAPASLKLAFDQSLSAKRKEWINDWIPDYTVEKLRIQPISSFIHHELIQFSIEDICRSIPRFTDGLKVSQRKIIWAAIQRWGNKVGEAADIMKVSQFAAYVADKLPYSHGEKSLTGAIVGMVQDFVGANNLPYFMKDGLYGSREQNGNDCGESRYIFTRPFITMNVIFRKEDEPIMKFKIEDGEIAEPITMLPILPLHLINGQLGVATAFSTYIPSHDPLDIVYWLESKLKGISPEGIIPWYRGFEGEIYLKERNKKKIEDESDENDEDEEEKDELFIDKDTQYTMVTTGYFEEGNKKNMIIIKEIPIGRSIRKYREILDRFREQKLIKYYDEYSTPDKPHFEVYGIEKPTLRKLKLIRSFGMSNMVLLDDNDKPSKYNNTDAILESFYTIRLSYYLKRKLHIIEEINKNIQTLNIKINFILSVIKGYEISKLQPNITDEEANKQSAMLVLGRNKKNILVQMDRLGFDSDLLKKVTLHDCIEEKVNTLRENIEKLEQEKKRKEEIKPEQLWLDDLQDFTKVYCKYYKCKYESPKPITLKIVSEEQ